MSCPICARDTDRRYRPFCSARCADIDLGKWLRGAYAIPAPAPDEDDDIDRAREERAQSAPRAR